MSMKFERCMDSEVVKFKLLSDDYSKVRRTICKILFLSLPLPGHQFTFEVKTYNHNNKLCRYFDPFLPQGFT